VSIISPKAFFASRADMVFMADSRCDPLRYFGQNGSFWQRRLWGFDPGVWGCSEFETIPENEGEQKGKRAR
jgi:hypothetical protein